MAQAKAAVNEGADYISVGPIFPTETKDAGPPVGVELLTEVSKTVSLPTVPVGGITTGNVAKVIQAGGKRVAVCSAVCEATDVRQAVTELRQQIP
jgi:thiamine-phosphate pyrophosphorylase